MNENWSWVGNWSEKRAIISPHRIAIFDNTTNTSYRYLDLDKRAYKVSNYLSEVGIKKGDKIALFSKNRIEEIDLFNATAKLGAVLVPFNIRLSLPEIIYLMNLTKPKLMFFDESLEHKMIEIKQTFPALKFISLSMTKKDNLTNLSKS